jgi:hypothetical protein
MSMPSPDQPGRRRWGANMIHWLALTSLRDTYGRTYLVYHRIYEDSS